MRVSCGKIEQSACLLIGRGRSLRGSFAGISILGIWSQRNWATLGICEGLLIGVMQRTEFFRRVLRMIFFCKARIGALDLARI